MDAPFARQSPHLRRRPSAPDRCRLGVHSARRSIQERFFFRIGLVAAPVVDVETTTTAVGIDSYGMDLEGNNPSSSRVESALVGGVDRAGDFYRCSLCVSWLLALFKRIGLLLRARTDLTDGWSHRYLNVVSNIGPKDLYDLDRPLQVADVLILPYDHFK